MTGQLSSVQKSVIVPYSMLIWLKKSTAEKNPRTYSNRAYMKPNIMFASKITGIKFPQSPLPSPLHRPDQTVDQCTLQLSGTYCVISHSQGQTANFGLPSVGEIHLKGWQCQCWCSICRYQTKIHTEQLLWHMFCASSCLRRHQLTSVFYLGFVQSPLEIFQSKMFVFIGGLTIIKNTPSTYYSLR